MYFIVVAFRHKQFVVQSRSFVSSPKYYLNQRTDSNETYERHAAGDVFLSVIILFFLN